MGVARAPSGCVGGASGQADGGWTQALFDGDPVVLVYPDGRELLFTPEEARGFAGLLLLLAVFLLRVRLRKADDNVVQLPPRTRIEARDSAGLPIAA